MKDSFLFKLAELSPVTITLVVTFFVLFGSMPTVYFISLILGVEYTSFLFILSTVLPILLTPPVIFVLLKSFKYLKYFRDELAQEIEKNKKQDVILFEQARFVLMGEMLANISHQWKQPLNTVGLSVISMKTSGKYPKELNKYSEIIEDNVAYLASTIDDFISFFDKKTHLELRDIDSIVKELQSIMGIHLKNKGIELEIDVDESYGRVKVASSISQVILNLINNAKDAIEGDKKEKHIHIQFLTNENGLEIECCDTGKGIEDSIKDKVFNPYFTTKPQTQGTGIGLYMSKEIVQKVFSGIINISSRDISRSLITPNINSDKTCFFIALPYSTQCILQKG